MSLPSSWRAHLGGEFEKDYMRKLRAFLASEEQAGKVIYPPIPQLFNAFELTPFEQVKVVILGQDPYHGEGQAHGLCFSVQPGVRPPPSLKNIFKEINSELGVEFADSGCLTSWAEQGVFLLNSVLTVEHAKAGAHQGKGWERFTDCAIGMLNPYHGEGQAHGLCFSVQPGVRPPPSLKNIFKEINSELGVEFADSGCLTSWAEQGVFLLNSVLTVEHAKAGAHQGKGWERFTDCAIGMLNEQHNGLVFLLWGKYAQSKASMIDPVKHRVLMSAHPSPFSAHRGFMGNGHFSQANDYLLSQGKTTIDWRLE